MPRVFRRVDRGPSSDKQRVTARPVGARVETLEQAVVRPTSGLVSALPSNPFDGQVIDFQSASMATLGLVWRFRYNASSSSPYKWECVGPAMFLNQIATSEATASAGSTDLATVGPSFTTPLAGDYVFNATCLAVNGTVTGTSSGLAITAASGSGALSSLATHAAAVNDRKPLTVQCCVTGMSASSLVKMQYASSGATSVSFSNRALSVTPVRVG